MMTEPVRRHDDDLASSPADGAAGTASSEGAGWRGAGRGGRLLGAPRLPRLRRHDQRRPPAGVQPGAILVITAELFRASHFNYHRREKETGRLAGRAHRTGEDR
jgi:hypothetical protein